MWPGAGSGCLSFSNYPPPPPVCHTSIFDNKGFMRRPIPHPYLIHTLSIPSIPGLHRAHAKIGGPGAVEVPERARKRPTRVELGLFLPVFPRLFDAPFAKFC